MKKIALVFYGQLRNIDECYPYWKKNIIEPLNIKDIFVHTYREETEGIKFNNQKTFSFKVGPSVLNEFNILYKPKIIMQDDYDILETTKSWMSSRELNTPIFRYWSFSIHNIFYSMYNVINIIDENTYDYIILSRTDNIFVKPITNIVIEDNELLTTNLMNIEYVDYNNPNMCNKFSCISDVLSAGNVKTMKKYASIFLFYKILVKNGLPFSVECLIGEYLKKLGIKITSFFKYPEEHHMLSQQQFLKYR